MRDSKRATNWSSQREALLWGNNNLLDQSSTFPLSLSDRLSRQLGKAKGIRPQQLKSISSAFRLTVRKLFLSKCKTIQPGHFPEWGRSFDLFRSSSFVPGFWLILFGKNSVQFGWRRHHQQQQQPSHQDVSHILQIWILKLIRQSWDRSFKDNLSKKWRFAHFEHSDWLLKTFQPIRALNTNVKPTKFCSEIIFLRLVFEKTWSIKLEFLSVFCHATCSGLISHKSGYTDADPLKHDLQHPNIVFD